MASIEYRAKSTRVIAYIEKQKALLPARARQQEDCPNDSQTTSTRCSTNVGAMSRSAGKSQTGCPI